jgi:hypothetical protein
LIGFLDFDLSTYRFPRLWISVISKN